MDVERIRDEMEQMQEMFEASESDHSAQATSRLRQGMMRWLRARPVVPVVAAFWHVLPT